jgi:CubicO group peptidase (beta-lactamase class C family)
MMQQVHDLMKCAVAERVFPGGVLLVSKADTVLFFRAYGRASIFRDRTMTKETVFDLASLTKPLATTLAVMKLIQTGHLDLGKTIGAYLPCLKGTDKDAITIQHLLHHTAGLPAYRPYFKILAGLPFGDREARLQAFLIQEPLESRVGAQVRYSDLGFMLLNWIIETVSRMRLDRFVVEKIYQPLGLSDLFFVDGTVKPPQKRYAATEQCPWRHQVMEGAVHDDNAYVMGGIAGHAGLFGTAADLHRLSYELLCGYHGRCSTVFQSVILQKFFNTRYHGERALGFDMPSVNGSSAGQFFSRNSVGHLGFTGTSFWIDLDRDVVVILLTNRIHPSRDNDLIKAFRPCLHDAVMSHLLS